MKYFYRPSDDFPIQEYGRQIRVDGNPLFNTATLFKIGDKAIIVVQEHWLAKSKAKYWGAVNSRLATDIYLNPNFAEYFKTVATSDDYPVMQVRKLMWAIRMKPLKKEFWEEGP